MKKKKVIKNIIVRGIDNPELSKKEPVKEKNIIPAKKNNEIERILIENFISLQKVMVNSSVKFDGLTHQISKLLELFEISAKALAEKDFEIEKNNRENAKLLEKIENVLEQNKTIAKGLTLMHEKINEPSNYPHQIPIQRMPPTQKLPLRSINEEAQALLRLKERQRNSAIGNISEEYHKPISSNEQ